jgi:DNA-binding IclR family transcriptional regulator
MSEPTNKQLAEAINHNADLLAKHLKEGVYVHRQETPSKIWAVQHSLGSRRPLIETYDSAGNRIGHGVNRETQTFDYAEMTFAVPISGTAILRF